MAESRLQAARIAVGTGSSPVQIAQLSDAEQQELVHRWGHAKSDFPRAATIHELFEQQVTLTPDSVAVIQGSESITYRQLNARANQLARSLRGMGVERDVPVALCIDRSPEMVVGLLAILKAGGAYVPLEAESPLQRLGWILADTEASVLLTTTERSAKFAEYSGRILLIDENNPFASESLTDNLKPVNSATDLAYVMYTSGSTGHPKGVSIPHRGVVRLVKCTNYAHFRSDDVFLQLAPLAFDASTFEIWGPLLNGACLAIAPQGILTLAEIGACVRRYHVTTLWLTAGLFHQMIDYQLHDLHGLKQLVAGGDVLSPAHVRRAAEELPDCQIINGYGPTENTTFTCCYAISRSSEIETRVPIGRPIANTEVYVLDSAGELAPPGVPGELYVGGDGLARAYWRRPELTRERFSTIELAPDLIRRLYRTGDRVRWREDGQLEFLGRLDEQVKIRGYRIEPGEIEYALHQHPAIAQVAVQTREDDAGNKRLTASVVQRQNCVTNAAQLTEFLASRLPSYMIPGEYHFLSDLPLTPNGKLDRKRLLELNSAAAAVRRMPLQFKTVLERRLFEMWRDLLDLEPVNADQTFFECGGDSLRALQLAARIRDAFGPELSILKDILGGTVAEQAAQIESAHVPNRTTDKIEKRSIVDSVVRPPSLAQQRLWFMHQLAPDSRAYTVALAYRFIGPLDVDAFDRCLSQIVERHETLRSTIASRNGVPEMRTAPASQFVMERLDLQRLSPDERDRQLTATFEHRARLRFDLEQGPLFRATLATVTETDHALLLTVHHIVFDGWSEGVFFSELAKLYVACTAGKPEPLAPLPFQYADYAIQERHRSARQFAADRDYWRRQLHGAPQELQMPLDYPRPVQQTFDGCTLARKLSPSLTNNLRLLSRQCHTTLFVTLLSAFKVVLYHYTRQNDMVVGTAVNNRESSDVERLIGFFANIVALRTDLSGNPTFVELLTRVQEVTYSALEHQRLSFEEVVHEVGVERQLSYPPLVQIVFVLHDARIELRGVSSRRMLVDPGGAKFDLTMTVVNEPDGLGIWAEFNTALLSESTVERFIERFEQLLQKVVKNPHGRFLEEARSQETKPATIASEGIEPNVVAPSPIRSYEYVERQVAAIWQKLLRVDSVRADEDFFRMGGHSLLTVELSAALAAEFGCQLSIAQLLQHRTIAAQTSLISTAPQQKTSSSLITVRSGVGRPLILFPKIGGSAFLCEPLVKSLPNDLPLKAIHLDGQIDSQSPTSVEELASLCVNVLKQSTIAPPYQFLGYSFGGMLAYETACQLKALGFPVELVGLIDAGPSRTTNPSLRWRLYAAGCFVRNVPNWLAHRIHERSLMSTFRYRLRKLGRWILRRRSVWTTDTKLDRELPDFLRGRTPEERQLRALHFQAYTRYIPKTYDGRVVLFRARVRPLLHRFTSDAGWSASKVGGLEIYQVPGSHISILTEPNSQILAGLIQATLGPQTRAIRGLPHFDDASLENRDEFAKASENGSEPNGT